MSWITDLFIGEINVVGGVVPETPHIIVCNHQSPLDVFVLHQVFPYHRIMAEKSVLTFLDAWIPNVCYSNKDGIEESVKLLNNKESIIICPAGWTSLTYVEKTWHKGYAVIAKQAKVPIVPIYIKYNSLRNNWINTFPSVVQWFLDLAIPRKRRGCVIYTELKRLKCVEKSGQYLLSDHSDVYERLNYDYIVNNKTNKEPTSY